MRYALLAALAVVISLPAEARSKPKDCGALPAAFEGTAFVGDGDTINGVGMTPSMRLWGLNAPELRDRQKAETMPGMRARAFLDDVLLEADHEVRCQPIEWDRYCRVVATCESAKGKDLTREMIEAGFAYGYYLAKHPDRVDQAKTYAHAEAAARADRRGLWPMWLGEKP